MPSWETKVTLVAKFNNKPSNVCLPNASIAEFINLYIIKEFIYFKLLKDSLTKCHKGEI